MFSQYTLRWRRRSASSLVVGCLLFTGVLLFKYRRFDSIERRVDDEETNSLASRQNVPKQSKQFNGVTTSDVREVHSEIRRVAENRSSETMDLHLSSGYLIDARSALQTLRANLSSWRFRHDNLLRLRKRVRDFVGEGHLDSAILNRFNSPVNSTVNFYKIPHSGNITITKTIWNQLPMVPIYAEDRFKTCGVVGSSGNLLRSKCGSQIDTKEFVFRMNNAPTSNEFALDVGKKTSQMLWTGKSMAKLSMNRPSLFQEPCMDRAVFPNQRFRDTTKPRPTIHLVRLPTFPVTEFLRRVTEGCRVIPASEGQLVLGNPQFHHSVNRFWRRRGLDMKVSSGLYSLSMALHLCRETHVYGFWPFRRSPEGGSVLYHYYDQLINVRVTHGFHEEFMILLKLHERGIIRLHVENCAVHR